jgi:hypothetical protein
MLYILSKSSMLNTINAVIKKLNNEPDTVVPFDPDNTDYQTFKKDLAQGASLKDAEGNDMTAEQITTFLGTLK